MEKNFKKAFHSRIRQVGGWISQQAGRTPVILLQTDRPLCFLNFLKSIEDGFDMYSSEIPVMFLFTFAKFCLDQKYCMSGSVCLSKKVCTSDYFSFSHTFKFRRNNFQHTLFRQFHWKKNLPNTKFSTTRTFPQCEPNQAYSIYKLAQYSKTSEIQTPGILKKSQKSERNFRSQIFAYINPCYYAP